MTVSDFVTRNTVPGRFPVSRRDRETNLEVIIQRLRADREFAQGNLEYEQEALLAAETCEEFFRHRLEVEHWKTRIEVHLLFLFFHMELPERSEGDRGETQRVSTEILSQL